MVKEGNVSLYQEQKNVRPLIEDVIRNYLDGENEKNAKDFISFLRFNKMPPQWASANSWSVSYKNKRVCYIKLGDGFWKIVHSGDYDSSYDVNINEYAWNNIHFCRNCARCSPGIHALIFGKEFDNVCFCGKFQFQNPDAETLKFAKILVNVRRTSIENNKVPKVNYKAKKDRK